MASTGSNCWGEGDKPAPARLQCSGRFRGRNWPLSEDEAEAHALGVPPLPGGPDRDGDGIADLDETELNLDPDDEADGWLDLDQDGYTEAWEAFIGSEPPSFGTGCSPALAIGQFAVRIWRSSYGE